MARRRSISGQHRRSRSVRVRKQTRRSRMARAFYRLLFLLLIIGAGALALTVFFKVNTVEVVGDSRYSADDLRQTLGVGKGDNLFFWDKAAAINRLSAKYPYLDEIQVKRKLPDTLVLSVTECQACAMVPSGDGYDLIDKNGKLLEQTTEEGAAKLPVIAGISAEGIKVGQKLGGKDGDAASQLVTLLAAFSNAGMMKDVNFINMNSLTDIRVGYEGRLDIHLGSIGDIAYKLRLFNTQIIKRLSPSDVGVMDLSTVPRAYFSPGTPESVAASAGTASAPTENSTEENASTDDSQSKNTQEEPQDGASEPDTQESGTDDRQVPDTSGAAA